MPSVKSIRILYMEDDPSTARLFQKRLIRAGYAVDLAKNGEEGLLMYEANPYDIVAVDQDMPIHDGLQVIRLLAERGPLPPTIMVTGAGDEKTAIEAMKLGARDYIVKDLAEGYLELLPTVIEQVLQQQRLIEEKQQAEAALRQYTAELQASNEELDAFSHTVAHDLQASLTNIISLAYVLKETASTIDQDKQQQHLQTILQSGQKMSNIIHELLLLASVRKLDAELEMLDMTHIVTEAQHRLYFMIESYQPQIILPSTWPSALGYGPWVEEVWFNYLSNALKYGGQPPRLELGATIQKDNMVRFWVRDNGPGLTEDAQSKLFTPFTHLNQVRAQGHGLGLSIVQRIVTKLNGHVGVQSRPDNGSTFWFTLPHVKG